MIRLLDRLLRPRLTASRGREVNGVESKPGWKHSGRSGKVYQRRQGVSLTSFMHKIEISLLLLKQLGDDACIRLVDVRATLRLLQSAHHQPSRF